LNNQETQKPEQKARRVWIVRHPFRAFFSFLGILIILGVGFLSWISYELLANKSCTHWRPNLTREEKILLALEWANTKAATLPVEITDLEDGKEVKFIGSARRQIQIPYASADVILRDQPDCCHLYSQYTAETDHPNEVLEKGDEGTVFLRYKLQYKDNNGRVHFAPTHAYVNFNFCKRD
jgi:hypothetical protein